MRKSTREHDNGQMPLTLVDWTAPTIVRISTPKRREGVEYALSPLRPNNRMSSLLRAPRVPLMAATHGLLATDAGRSDDRVQAVRDRSIAVVSGV